MTARVNCHAIYNGRLDNMTLFDPPDVSGLEDANPMPYVDTDDRVSDASMPIAEETPGQTQQDRAPFVELFPLGAAGAPISNVESVLGYQALRDKLGPDNIWYPFQSQRDWDFAQWAKNWGSSSTAVTELLAIDGIVRGNPGVCRGYPYPYPEKPVPVTCGYGFFRVLDAGFDGYCGVQTRTGSPRFWQ
ncbi:hypothetical protein EDB84DRAFT_1445344 [Lactarius hengduanensis]|nr:hypothetical protein EDB84DRAFT_1445344 [Lactarius hengduanensis]